MATQDSSSTTATRTALMWLTLLAFLTQLPAIGVADEESIAVETTAHTTFVDSHVQLLPTEVPTIDAPPLLTTDVEHNKLILTAGTQNSEAGNAAQPQVTVVSQGTSSRRERKAAVQALGLNRLPWQNQQLAQSIVDDVSIFRRLPGYRCEVDPRVHDYFTQHPDAAVGIWRAMGISQLKMWELNDWAYGMDTQDGTTGKINVLYRSRESCLILCRGMLKSPYIQNPIKADSLFHLRTRFTTDAQGRTFATHQADMFVSFPSQRVETIAKLVSPVSNVIIDRNFQEISLFIHVMWLAMGRQPGWVEQMAEKLNDVDEALRDELIQLTAQVYVDTQTTRARRAGKTVSIDDIRPPMKSLGDDTRPVSASTTDDAITR